MTSPDDLNGGAMFQGAKLFELFGAFEWGGPPTDESHEEIALVAIDPDMPEGLRVAG
jgi:hypothetical protein